MFKGHPKGLWVLALANTGERFGYYTMMAIFTMYMMARFGWTEGTAGLVNAIFLMVVYVMPLLGGILADRIGYGKCVTVGFAVMFLGYLGMASPVESVTTAQVLMFGALFLICLGTGLFKGNLQVLVGNLYDDPKYSERRDSAFSLFYMAINIGAMFAPAMANWITKKMLMADGFDHYVADPVKEFGEGSAMVSQYLESLSGAYGICFGVACVSVIVSVLIYFSFKKTFKHADVTAKQTKDSAVPVVELTPKQTSDRIKALCLVFAVVIFFWMVFHQNGSALTFFAKKYTNLMVTGPVRIGFNIFSLALLAVSVYTIFSFFQSTIAKTKVILGIATVALWGGAYALFAYMSDPFQAQPSDFQQFNPFFVVALTPVSMAIFAAIAKARGGREVSAPSRIAWGMLVAGLGFGVVAAATLVGGLTSPMDLQGTQPVLSPNWLISTYFTLTLAELLLSPMGISFVSRVAPPKYKGLMMGGWFLATGIGNLLSALPSLLWDKIPLMYNWCILIGLCFLSSFAMFALLKKLNKMTE